MKKAIVADTVIVLILALVSFIALLSIAPHLEDASQMLKIEKECQAKITLARNTRVPITNSGVLPKCGAIKEDLTGSQDKIMNDISIYSAFCWRMYFQGTVSDIFGARLWNREDSACAICAVLTYKADDSTKFVGADLKRYMQDTPYQLVDTRNNQYDAPQTTGAATTSQASSSEQVVTFLDYLQNGGLGWLQMPDDLVFGPNRGTYAIVFVEPHSFLNAYGSVAQQINRQLVYIDYYSNIKKDTEYTGCSEMLNEDAMK